MMELRRRKKGKILLLRRLKTEPELWQMQLALPSAR